MFLNVHSNYSLRYGTMPIKALIVEALRLGITQFVLTDINNSSGCMQFIREAREAGIKPVIGIEFRRDKHFLYTGIARNKEGMRQLNQFLSTHNLNKTPLPDRPDPLPDAVFIYPLENYPEDLKPNEFIGVRPGEVTKLFRKEKELFKQRGVAFWPVTVANRIEHRLHLYLRAIDRNVLLSKVRDEDCCRAEEMFAPPDEVSQVYAAYPFLISNAKELLAGCNTDEYVFGILNKRLFSSSKKDDKQLLEKLAWAGLEYRYGKHNREAAARVKKELKVIYELGFCAYFLITWDIIRYSMSQGYYHVGRGSGANSIVAYCLRITDVDPIELDLYFERFLNPKRSSPPDFDIDYSWDEREDVQDYIFKRYGAEHVALLGTMSTFKDRAIFHEIGKVLGLTPGEIKSFTDPHQDERNRDNSTFSKLMSIHALMKYMPNQRSIHAGGVLICEESIYYYSALDLPPKNMPVVQWDMYEAELIGLDKFDILSQRGIGHIKEAVKLVRQNRRISIDIHDVKAFKNDPRLNEEMRAGRTIGCFYIESPAMRQLLKKLNCDTYLVLVAASSIIRPGVAASGMMPAYIRYHHAPGTVKYLHPVMEEQLKETYGVMVYQEDVIKVCHHYAGLDLADADVLRRAMSGKYRSPAEMDRIRERFFSGSLELGRDSATTAEVWRQVSSFAGYSFSKAHSASFAVESYQSLYLKTYYPMEFMVAVLNNHGGFYTRWFYVNELQLTGAKVHLPCVNHSERGVSISGSDVWLSLECVQRLESKFTELIPEERKTNGPYKSLDNFIRRTAITLDQCIILIRLGAMRFTGLSKKELLWQVYGLIGKTSKRTPDPELFQLQAKNYQLPDMAQNALEDAYQEFELLGFSVTLSYFELLKEHVSDHITAAELPSMIGKRVRMIGNYVAAKYVPTKTKKMMYFGSWLDHTGASFDSVHFPQYAPVVPFRGGGCYFLKGKVVEEYGVCSLEVYVIEKLEIRGNPVLID